MTSLGRRQLVIAIGAWLSASLTHAEEPHILELVINARTAMTLGLKMPQSLLVRAERVIG